MTDLHLEIAYWSVLNDLEAPIDIPIEPLKTALPIFLVSTGSSTKASEVIYNCLSNIEWDWPVWNDFAKKLGYNSLQSIDVSISKMEPNEILMTLSATELKQLCREKDLTLTPRTLKSELILKLLEVTGIEASTHMIFLFAKKIRTTQYEKCRKQMAQYITHRILTIAYNMNRYEQLTDPDLLSLCPSWRFVWSGTFDNDAPKSCQKFSNKKFPHYEAMEFFPTLPCEYLKCSCRITAEKT